MKVVIINTTFKISRKRKFNLLYCSIIISEKSKWAFSEINSFIIQAFLLAISFEGYVIVWNNGTWIFQGGNFPFRRMMISPFRRLPLGESYISKTSPAFLFANRLFLEIKAPINENWPLPKMTLLEYKVFIEGIPVKQMTLIRIIKGRTSRQLAAYSKPAKIA